MDAASLLELMRKYFVGKQPQEVLDTFATVQPTALLKESLDVVDFVVYLEEELDREIDMNRLGDALVNQTFGQLAAQVSQMIAAEGA